VSDLQDYYDSHAHFLALNEKRWNRLNELFESVIYEES